MSPAAKDCSSALRSRMSLRPASSRRFRAVTGGTSKPRLASATTSPSAASRQSVSRRVPTPTPYSAFIRSSLSFCPGSIRPKTMSSRRR